MKEKTIFQKIIDKEIPSDIIYESDTIIVICDINPQASIHYLIIPKENFITVSDIPSEKMNIMIDMCNTAKWLSCKDELHSNYKLIINNGRKAGQCIFHLHMHFLAGF